MNVKTILVPLDGSLLAEMALTPAADLAREKRSTSVRTRLVDSGVGNVETSVWYGPPAEAIVAAGHSRGADLIMMSSHGRSGLGRLVLGSVAEMVLRATPTPILLIRASGAPLAAPYRGRPAAKELGHV